MKVQQKFFHLWRYDFYSILYWQTKFVICGIVRAFLSLISLEIWMFCVFVCVFEKYSWLILSLGLKRFSNLLVVFSFRVLVFQWDTRSVRFFVSFPSINCNASFLFLQGICWEMKPFLVSFSWNDRCHWLFILDVCINQVHHVLF